MKEFRLSDEEIKLIEKWSGKKFYTDEDSTNKKSNSKKKRKGSCQDRCVNFFNLFFRSSLVNIIYATSFFIKLSMCN